MDQFNIIFDTDIGDDIDDALALALALKLPTINIVGITTCFKNTHMRARIAKKMLQAAGRSDIAVCAGVRSSEAIPVQYTKDLDADKYAPSELGAVDFIVSMAKELGKKLFIVAVGPLINIAEAYKKAPEVMSNIGGVYVMGGNFFGGKFEWNFRCAPSAAATVLSDCDNVFAVGTDVTYKTLLPPSVRAIMERDGQSPMHSYLAELVRLWYANAKREIFLHDPITLLALTNPQHFTFVRQNIYVESEGVLQGLCVNFSLSAHFVRQSGNPVNCAKEIQTLTLVQLFLDTVYGCASSRAYQEHNSSGGHHG